MSIYIVLCESHPPLEIFNKRWRKERFDIKVPEIGPQLLLSPFLYPTPSEIWKLMVALADLSEELPGRSCWSWRCFALMVKTARDVPSKRQGSTWDRSFTLFTANWLESNGCEASVNQGSIWCAPWHEWMKLESYCGVSAAKWKQGTGSAALHPSGALLLEEMP